MISNIVNTMLEYQKENSITKQCVTNVQYLYDFIVNNDTIPVHTKPVIVMSVDNDTLTIIRGHLVVISNETTIESSYEVDVLKNKYYYDNIKELINNFNISKPVLKRIIIDFLNIQKLSDRINKGEFVITDEDFYNKQADYIEKKFEKFIK